MEQRRPHLLAIVDLETVDAQVERGALVERRHLPHHAAAEDGIEMRMQPSRIVAAHFRRHVAMLELMARERSEEPLFLAVEWSGTEPVPVTGLRDGRRLPAFDHRQRRQHPPARVDRQFASVARDPPVERGALAQHGIDMLGDGAAVLRAGEAVAAEIIGDDVVGGRAALLDFAEQPDRRLYLRAGGHG